jgi:hypothetical protein
MYKDLVISKEIAIIKLLIIKVSNMQQFKTYLQLNDFFYELYSSEDYHGMDEVKEVFISSLCGNNQELRYYGETIWEIMIDLEEDNVLLGEIPYCIKIIDFCLSKINESVSFAHMVSSREKGKSITI